jgi:hypothetical protein
MFEVRSCEKGALHDNMLNGLEGCTTLVGNLIWSVLGEEPLRVFACKGMTCDPGQDTPETLYLNKSLYV